MPSTNHEVEVFSVFSKVNVSFFFLSLVDLKQLLIPFSNFTVWLVCSHKTSEHSLDLSS